MSAPVPPRIIKSRPQVDPALLQALAEVIQAEVQPLRECIAELAPLLKELDATLNEQRKTPADWFRGSWLNGTSYARGEQVQMRGKRWMSMIEDNRHQPGNSTTWREY